MPPTLRKAQIRRLGERLCVEQPSGDDLDKLAQLQDEYLAALEAVDVQLRERLGIAPGQLFDGVPLTLSNRLKRDRRIIEKLWRGTELDRMQDIVGFRVVGAFTLSQQNDLTERVRTTFKATVKDRRAQPSYGYRAVHLVFDMDGFLVEVQVRTLFQDAWAQVMERFSERWGREIQYGGAPDPAGIDAATLERRTEAVAVLKASAVAMGAQEAANDELHAILRQLDDVDLDANLAGDSSELRNLMDRAAEAKKLVDERLNEIRQMFANFVRLAGG